MTSSKSLLETKLLNSLTISDLSDMVTYNLVIVHVILMFLELINILNKYCFQTEHSFFATKR